MRRPADKNAVLGHFDREDNSAMDAAASGHIQPENSGDSDDYTDLFHGDNNNNNNNNRNRKKGNVADSIAEFFISLKSSFVVFYHRAKQMTVKQLMWVIFLVALVMLGSIMQIIMLNFWLTSFPTYQYDPTPGSDNSGSEDEDDSVARTIGNYTAFAVPGILFTCIFVAVFVVYYVLYRPKLSFTRHRYGWLLLVGIGFTDTFNSWLATYAASHTAEVLQALFTNLSPLYAVFLCKWILLDSRRYFNVYIVTVFVLTIVGIAIASVFGIIAEVRQIGGGEWWIVIFFCSIPFRVLQNVWQSLYMIIYTRDDQFAEWVRDKVSRDYCYTIDTNAINAADNNNNNNSSINVNNAESGHAHHCNSGDMAEGEDNNDTDVHSLSLDQELIEDINNSLASLQHLQREEGSVNTSSLHLHPHNKKMDDITIKKLYHHDLPTSEDIDVDSEDDYEFDEKKKRSHHQHLKHREREATTEAGRHQQHGSLHRSISHMTTNVNSANTSFNSAWLVIPAATAAGPHNDGNKSASPSNRSFNPHSKAAYAPLNAVPFALQPPFALSDAKEHCSGGVGSAYSSFASNRGANMNHNHMFADESLEVSCAGDASHPQENGSARCVGGGGGEDRCTLQQQQQEEKERGDAAAAAVTRTNTDERASAVQEDETSGIHNNDVIILPIKYHQGDDTTVKLFMLAAEVVFQLLFTLALLPADALPWWGNSRTVSETANNFSLGIQCVFTLPLNFVFGFLYTLGFVFTYVGCAYLNHYSVALCSIVSQLSAPLTALLLVIFPALDAQATQKHGNGNGGGEGSEGHPTPFYVNIIAIVLLSVAGLVYVVWEENTDEEKALTERYLKARRLHIKLEKSSCEHSSSTSLNASGH